MSKEDIRLLLSEFDYNKNSLEDTLEFLLRMCWSIVRLEGIGNDKD